MIDIEDMEEPIRRMPLEQVEIKRIKQRGINESQAGVNDILPGTSSIFVKTWGCGHNNSDGEYMAGILADYGYNVILDHSLADNADLWVLNSCTVKGPSEQTFVNDIDKAVGSGKKVVVAGCVPQGSPRQFQQYSIVGVQQIDQIVHVVEETLRGNIVQLLRDAKTGQVKLRKAGGAKLDLPKIRRNQFIEIIPVNTGCLNQCTYCKTKHARGDLGSYEIDEIVDRVNSVLDQEVLEIWLTSEDIGAYGKDIGVSIVDLLWKIVHAMENHPSKTSMLRIGMTNPPYIKEHVEEMAKILAHPRVYSFLHIPVQAGCDKVLTDMRRLYVIEDFEFIVNYLRDKVPGITIATDIICGFPTESDESFQETMRVLRTFKFSVLHISQFYPRPGTPASRMKRLNTQVVKSRSREATSFFESYTSYEKLLNTNQRVLVTEISADGKNYVGHNKFYHQVLVPKDPRLMGQSFDVRIVSVHKWHVMGEVIESSLCLDPLVLPKRAPKLVRKQRKVHTIENGSSEGRKDGAYLSSGKRSFSTHQLYISIFIALALIIWKLEFRWSLRILIIVLLLGILFRMRNE